MKRAIDIIRNEHRALAAVMGSLKSFVDGVAAGKFEMDHDLLEAMIEYVLNVPEKVHHPKEDGYLFPAVRRRSDEADAVIAELQEEHHAGPARVAELARDLAAYRAAGPSGFPAFHEQVKAYVESQWKHMSKEEVTVMPLARRVLSAQDWAEIDAAFVANGNPWEGPAGEYKELFKRIVNLAPAPIGVGGKHA